MKVLICTQAVDTNDPVLSFFVGWIREIAARSESVRVICLTKGEAELPDNVHVFSLGKEAGVRSSLSYAVRFLTLVWRERAHYDTVFVHMNEEYVLLAGVVWRLLGKRVGMWRNHYAGSWKTRVAVFLAHRVWCTSRSSFTARFKKTRLMPVGVDTTRFAPRGSRTDQSILVLGRMAPSKHPDLIIRALREVHERNVAFTATFVGSPPTGEEAYYAHLKAEGERIGIRFLPGVRNDQTPALFDSHDIYINASRSGMYDKTLFEAAASGTIVLASSSDFAAEIPDGSFAEGDSHALAVAIEQALRLSPALKETMRARYRAVAQTHDNTVLFDRLVGDL